jgi:hypothetical protein
MSSRRYLKRVWRVPKDRGPVEYLAALLVKALRKHGWPADWKPASYDPYAFSIIVKEREGDLPDDFAHAVHCAVRIAERAYRIDVTETGGFVTFNRAYRVGPGGHFKELKE